MDKGFDIRSKTDKMEKDLGEWICDIQSLQNKAHSIRSKLLVLGVKTDDFSHRKSFDISKLIPASQNVQTSMSKPTKTVSSTISTLFETLQVMKTMPFETLKVMQVTKAMPFETPQVMIDDQ